MSDAARNVLVVGPSIGSATDELCTRLTTDVRPVGTVLGATVVQSPADRCRCWSEYGSLEDVSVEFVDVDSTTRAASASGHNQPTPADIDRVTEPTDLSAIRQAITDRLHEAEGETALCFHSLTALLNYVEIERALEFLHAVTADVREAKAYAHYHLDVNAHDEETVDLFGTVTDRVIELSRDGSDVSVR